MSDEPEPPIVVIKVGGSLIDWPPLPGRLALYLASRAAIRPVLIAGGGAMVDVLRRLDGLHGLGESRSHAIALRVLDVTADLLASLMPGSIVATTLEELPALWTSRLIPILAPRGVLLDDDRLFPRDALPHRWSTTSDSIAARVAVILGASELILLKSTPPPSSPFNLNTLAALGLTDAEFPTAARRLAVVRLECLRSPDPIVPDEPVMLGLTMPRPVC